MIEIEIVSFGSIKEKYLTEMINDYKTRISKFAKITFIELKDEPLKDSTLKVLEAEALKLENILKNTKYLITLDIDGVMLDSEAFASKIDEIATYKSNKLTFLIGGSYGILEEVKRKSQLRFSFSKLTFPHQLMKGILLEQIYRSFKILNNEKYHK